jgi:WD40 repeat protein
MMFRYLLCGLLLLPLPCALVQHQPLLVASVQAGPVPDNSGQEETRQLVPVEADAIPDRRAHFVLDIGGHAGRPVQLLFTPDGKKLVSAAEDRTVQVWDVVTKERLRVFRPPLGADGLGSAPQHLAVDRLGERGAFWVEVKDDKGQKVRTTFVCSLATGQMHSLPHGGEAVFSPDGKSLVILDGHHLRQVEIATGETRKTVKVLPDKAKNAVRGVAFSPDGRMLAIVAEDEKVYLHDAETLESKRTLTVPGDGNNLRNVGWADDRTVVCRSFSPQKALVVLDVGSGEVKHSYQREALLNQLPKGNNESFVNVQVITGTTKVLIRTTNSSGWWTDCSFLLDWASGEASKGYQIRSPYGCHATAVAPDLSIAAQGDGSLNDIILWNPGDGRALLDGKSTRRLRAAVRGANGFYWSIRWRPDGRAVVWEKLADGNDKGHAELDLASLTLRSLTAGEFDKIGRENRARGLGGKQATRKEADDHIHERGIVREWGPLTLNREWPNLHIAGSPQPVICRGLGPVDWDYSFVGEGLVAAEGYNSSVLQIFDPATGKRLHATRVVQSFIQSLAVSPRPECRYLLIGSDDQTLTVYNPATGKVLMTVFPTGTDWIAWTPQGYYAGTPGGERLMGWQVDNGPDQVANYYPADRFRKQLYRPDVLKLVLETGVVEEALKAANAALPPGERPATNDPADLSKLLPPAAKLTLVKKSDAGEVTLEVAAKAGAKEQPIKSLRLYLDGRPFDARNAAATFEAGVLENKQKWTLTLPPGKHHLAVLARSSDASAVSKELEIDSGPHQDKPVLHVLAIGINKYQDRDLNLASAANDAELITRTFETACKGELFGQVRAQPPLLNEKATRDKILEAIHKLRTDARANDLAVVFFAGHGAKFKDEFYLAPHEVKVDDLPGTALAGKKLRDDLAEFPCQVLLLLDACQAAGFGENGKLAQKKLKPATDDATRLFTADEVGVVVMCASMGYETATEDNKNGLFTRAFTEALTATKDVPFNHANHRQYIHHLQSYVFDKVAEESKEKQHPFLHLPWVVQSFPLRQLPKPSPGER